MAPTSPRWEKWRRTVALGLVGALVLVGLGFFLYIPKPSGPLVPPPNRPPPTQYVVVEDVDLIVSYTTSGNGSTSYLVPPGCDVCPTNLSAGSTWTFSFNLTNTDPARAHSVTGFEIDSPFTLIGIEPALPASLPVGASQAFTLTIGTPAGPGYFTVTGSIDTE